MQVYQHSGVDDRSLSWKFIKIKTATQAFSGDLYRILNGRNTAQDYLRFTKDFWLKKSSNKSLNMYFNSSKVEI